MKELLQRYLHSLGLYKGRFDAQIGPQTQAAINALLAKRGVSARSWDDKRRYIAALQLMALDGGQEVGKIDGLQGPQTKYALELYVNKRLGLPTPMPRDSDPETPAGIDWPAYRDMVRFFGEPGGDACTAGRVKVPYRMVLAWDPGKEVKTIQCHERVADSMESVLKRVASAYSPEQIEELGLHLFGGCYNFRKMRGGSRPSVHSWGAAVDFDPERNQLKWGRPRARLSHPDAARFWELWEAEGWLSLGRARDYDWMHVQAAGL